jgi:hypothetical protein
VIVEGLRPWETVVLRYGGSAAALAGLVALVAHVMGVLRMPYAITFIGAPSIVALFALAVWARRIAARPFIRALAVGTIGGFAATLAYDVVRFLLQTSGVFDYNGFYAIALFGSWIAGSSPSDPIALAAGWTYHFWNGMSFGLFYALLFGGRHWLYGVIYGVTMEAAMLGLFPLFLQVTNRADFIALSLIGHLAYGGVLGLAVQRYGMPWHPRRAQ